MDWSKAKNVLIIIFVMVNIFLFITINNLYKTDTISESTLLNTIKALEIERNVVVKCGVPSYNSDVGTLSFTGSELDRVSIVNKLLKQALTTDKIKNSVEFDKDGKRLTFKTKYTFEYDDNNAEYDFDLAQITKIEDYIKSFLSGVNLPILKFCVDKVEQNKDGSLSIVLIEKYKGFLIFDNFIKATVSKRGIVHLECNYKEIKEITSSKKKIVPAYQVLLKNYVNNGTPQVITGVDIGFKEHILEAGTKELNNIPVWRINMGNNVVRYFQAFDGYELK